MYLYKAVIYKQPATLGVPANTHTADKLDFETNFKTQAAEVTEVLLAETTFVIDKTYTQFKALIVTPVTWSDVKYTDDLQKYILSLLRDTLL